MSDWTRMDMHEPDVELITRRAMLEHGHPDIPELTAFAMFATDDDGEQLVLRVLNVVNAANLIKVLAPRSLEIVCDDEESKDELLANIRALIDNGTVLH